jgi:hypothetical protein
MPLRDQPGTRQHLLRLHKLHKNKTSTGSEWLIDLCDIYLMRIETRMKLMDHLRPECRKVCHQELVVGENGSELLVEERGVVATELLINLEFKHKNVRSQEIEKKIIHVTFIYFRCHLIKLSYMTITL